MQSIKLLDENRKNLDHLGFDNDFLEKTSKNTNSMVHSYKVSTEK